MMDAVLTIGVILALLVLIALTAVARVDASITALKKDVNKLQEQLAKGIPGAPDGLEGVHQRMQELDARYELLKKNFMKILSPIRSSAEDIAQLDDDLARLQKLYEEIKKGASTPPSAA